MSMMQMQAHTAPGPANERARRATVAVILLLGPLLAFGALRLSTISQNSFTDAMYYLGYANNFSDLVERYGFVYYAVRFGPIFSEMAFAKLFGALNGFLALRYLLAVAVGYLIHAVLAERYGWKLALIGVVAWLFNPVTARILLSSYVDSTAVPLTMAGMLLLLRDRGRSTRRAFLAGVLLCAGVSGNPYSGVMIALGLPAYALLARGRTFRAVCGEMLATLAGSLVMLGAFTWIYQQWFGISSLIQPAFAITKRLAGGESKLWTRPPEQWLFDSPHNYAPFLLLAATVIAWSRGRDRLALAAGVYLALFIAFYWISDLAFDGYSLSFYPYYSYWSAALLLGTGACCCIAVQGAPEEARAKTAAGCLVALVVPALFYALTGIGALPPIALAIIAIAALALLTLAIARPDRRGLAVIGLIGGAAALQAGSWVYNAPLGKPEFGDRELVKAALHLTEFMPRIRSDGKQIAFWYRDDPGRRLQMLQSIYLPFSRLRRADGTPVETPALAPADLEILTNPQLGHLLIIDFDRQRVDDALASLARAGVPHRIAQRRILGTRRQPFEFAHVMLRPPTEPRIARYEATAVTAHPDARIRHDANGATLTTGRTVFAWDGVIDLTGIAQAGRPLIATVRLQVLAGRIGLALIQRGTEDRLLNENLAPRTDAPVEVSVRVPDAGQAEVLALRNWMEDGSRSVVRILDVTLHQPKYEAAR